MLRFRLFDELHIKHRDYIENPDVCGYLRNKIDEHRERAEAASEIGKHRDGDYHPRIFLRLFLRKNIGDRPYERGRRRVECREQYHTVYCAQERIYLIAEICTAKLILYTQGVEMGQDIIVLGT